MKSRCLGAPVLGGVLDDAEGINLDVRESQRSCRRDGVPYCGRQLIDRLD